ncbi:hypothetical protein [Bradyrhizobium sp. 2TAF24]|uniref:hypothetical protein n=1 Tax=Bradyrhizobium sp. 2TAF24 TaxID=3233011 RepID=UPI003F91CDC6
MTDIESLILAEARRQGYQPNADAVRQASIDLAGSVMTSDGLIAMPGRGSVSKADFVTSLRNHLPGAFLKVQDTPAASDERRPGETLTDFMRRRVEADRKRSVPDDWDEVRSKVTGLTAQMMDARVAAIREGR